MYRQNTVSISEKMYSFLLYFYPRKYRLEYGNLMIQLFKDIERDIQESHISNKEVRLWEQILPDFIISLGQEYISSFRNFIPFIMKAHVVLGFLNLAVTIALMLLTYFFNQLTGGYASSSAMVNSASFIKGFLIICILINAFFSYKLFFFQKHHNKNYIYASLLGIFSIFWMYVIWGGMVFSLFLFFPVSILFILGLVLAATWKSAQIFSVIFCIITVVMMCIIIPIGAKERYCVKKLNETPDVQIDLKNQETVNPMDTYYACKEHFNILSVLAESYL